MKYKQLQHSYLGTYSVDGKIYDVYESINQIIVKYGNKELYKYSVDKIVIPFIFNDLLPPLRIACRLAQCHL